jgi:Spy/CpxP family protein refolding chaperone
LDSPGLDRAIIERITPMALRKLTTIIFLVGFAATAVGADSEEVPVWTWGPTGVMYLQSKAVQDELKLKPDQLAKIKELGDQRRMSLGDPAKMKEFADMIEIALPEILQPDQAKRLRQIQLQKQGPMALRNPTIAAELGLTDKQKEMLNAMTAKAPPQLVIGKTGDKIQIGRKEDPNAAATPAKMLAVLTAKQRTKWNELLGKPFKGSVVPAKP